MNRRFVVSCEVMTVAGALLFGVATAWAEAREPASLLQHTAAGHTVGFGPDRVFLAARSHMLSVEFVNADPAQPVAEQSGTALRDKATPLARVSYSGLWKGVDLAYDSPQGGVLRSTWTVAPGGDPGHIRLRYNVPVTVAADGFLQFPFADGLMRESAPVAWQESRGVRVPVQVAFRTINVDEVGFALGPYDPGSVLWIDPTITWNTFIGGTGTDYGMGIALDADGNAYVTGYSSGAWGTPVREYGGGQTDAFVVKIDSGGVLQWHTFLGSSGSDQGQAVAVDGSGNAYVTGHSGGTWGSPLSPHNGGPDAFVAKLDGASGTLQWLTFLGSSSGDYAWAIALDANGSAYVAGSSDAAWGGPLRMHAGDSDAFVARLESTGALQWHTFLGSSAADDGFGIAVDGEGNAYVTGASDAAWGSPVRAHSGGPDAFVAKLTGGGTLAWNSFFGSASLDRGQGIGVDGSGNAYLAGYSARTWGIPLIAYQGAWEAFVARLDGDGALQWHTFLGGTDTDYGQGIAVDAGGNAFIAGHSYATWGVPLYEPQLPSGNGFVAKLDSSGALHWNTFFGAWPTGTGDAQGIALDGVGNAYVVGYSYGPWGSPLSAHNGGVDAFVTKVRPVPLSVKTFASTASLDGWVRESGESTGQGGSLDSLAATVRVGDDALNKQYRAFLAFNTATLPDNSLIFTARLNVRYQGATGTNPFVDHGNLVVDAALGGFSGRLALQATDFQAPATRLRAGTIPSSSVGGWYSATIPGSCVNRTGVSQFRVRFAKDDDNDFGADYVSFFSGNAAAASRPLLEVQYYVP